MKNILRNMKPYWKTIILIVIFLTVEAYCDLALPQFTSGIIDTGIQNQGIVHILPEKIKEKEFQEAELFMTSGEKEAWENAYKKENGTRTLIVDDEEKLDELDELLITPVAMAHELGHMPESSFRKMISKSFEDKNIPGFDLEKMSLDEIEAVLGTEIDSFEMKNEDGEKEVYIDTLPLLYTMSNEGITGEDFISDSRKTMEKTLDTMGITTVKSMGKAYAAFCNEEAGIDNSEIQTEYLWITGFKMFLIALVMLCCSVTVSFLAARTGAGVGRNLRTGVFEKVMSFSSAEMDRYSTSSLITRNTNDIQQIQTVTAVLLRMVLYAPIIGIGGIYQVAKTGAGMGWIVGLALLFIVGFVSVLVSVTMPKFKKMQEIIDNLNCVSREILTGIPVIRAFVREKTEEERFDVINRRLQKVQLFTNRVMTMMMPGMLLIMNALVVLITFVSAHRIDDGKLQVGVMTAFITYSMLIVMAFLMMTMMSIMLPRAGVAADRIQEVLTTEVAVKDSEHTVIPEKCNGIIEFKNVSFRYPGAGEDVIHNISFKAEPGKTTAIIGSTGAGKSTLINLIPRFYDVTEGSITLDGCDIRELPLKYLRNRIGLVPQKGILFSGTIASNLRFGKENATAEEVREAAAIAQAEDFIMEKDEQFASPIAQGGNNVSGGQKQRLAIARAIAGKPEILVFDDSFSALDMKTDAKLRKELDLKVSDSAKIIVAQRISSIINAEQIIVLDEGEIAGKGTHDELMENCEVYRQIAKSQLSEKELEERKVNKYGKDKK